MFEEIEKYELGRKIFLQGIAFGILSHYLGKKAKGESTSHWVNSKETDYGSFIWCCKRLGLDPQGAAKRFKKLSADAIKDDLNRFYESIEKEEEEGSTEDETGC